MTDRKTCIRCERSIDEFAKTCPFCNWDQTEIPPPQEGAAPAYVPPPERRFRGKILGIVAFASLLIIAFVVGTLIHGWEPSAVKAAETKEQGAPVAMTPAHRSNVTLVPVSGSDVPQWIEQPITSAPAQMPGEQPNDATALPAQEYAAAAARAKAEREASEKARTAIVDPRTITGSAYHQPARPVVQSETEKETPASSVEGPPETINKTAAYLQYKPLPHISVAQDVTARLNLTVDSDGRVTDIDVNDTVPEMPKVISAVQNWRFKPATVNGNAVTSHVAVDIKFRAND